MMTLSLALPYWPAVQFDHPLVLWLLPIPLLIYLLVPARRSQAPALRTPYAEANMVVNTNTVSSGHGPNLFVWLAWIALVVAAAIPKIEGPPISPPAQGRDLMVVLDLSASMSADDMVVGAQRVDRLTAAKVVLNEFLAQRDGDRVGLIVFGSNAYVLTPMTRDLDTVREQLIGTATSLAGPATAIGDALALAVKRLDQPEFKQRVVVLLTDGYNTAGELSTDAAAEMARTAGIRVYTIGFGDDPALTLFGFRIPIAMAPQLDVDEDALKRVAQTTGGQFYRARKTEELSRIYNQIQQLEPVAHKAETIRPMIHLYYWPLALALAMGFAGLLWHLLTRRRHEL